MKELFDFLGSFCGTVAKELFTKSRQDHYDALSPLGKKIQDIFGYFVFFVIALVWSAPWILELYDTVMG